MLIEPHVSPWGRPRGLVQTAPIDFMTLAARWIIAPERVKKTVQLTTQRGVCTCLNPMLAQQFPTNDRILCYKQLQHTTFTDTLFAGTPSCSGNKCAQAFSTYFGWVRAHPMTRMRPCPYYSIVTECPRPWYLMALKSNAKETLKGNFARLIATQDRPNPTPRGSRPLKVVSVNWNLGCPVKWLRPSPPGYFGTTVLNLKRESAHWPVMMCIWSMAKCQRP